MSEPTTRLVTHIKMAQPLPDFGGQPMYRALTPYIKTETETGHPVFYKHSEPGVMYTATQLREKQVVPLPRPILLTDGSDIYLAKDWRILTARGGNEEFEQSLTDTGIRIRTEKPKP